MSLFTQVLDIRDEFRQIANENFDILTNILTDQVLPQANLYSQALNDQVLMTLKTDETAAYNVIKFTDNVSGDIILEVPTSELGKYGDTIVDELNGLSVNDYLDQASSSANLYNVLSNISGKYAYLNRQKYTDVVNMLQDAAIKNKNSLISALGLAADTDGYISVGGFFGIIKNYFEVANRGTNNGSLELDTTNPYKFLSIFSIISGVVEAVFNTLIMVLSGLFRVILGLLEIVFKLFTTAFSSLQNKEVATLDSDAGNNYILGPVLAWDSSQATYQTGNCTAYNVYDSSPSGWWDPYNFDVRNIFLQEEHGVASFSWMIDPTDFNSGCRNNVYFYPYFDVRRINWRLIFKDNNHMSGNAEISFDLDVVQEPLSIYYIPQDGSFDSWPHYDDTHVPQTANEMVLSVAFGLFIRHCQLIKQCVAHSSPTYGIWDLKFLYSFNNHIAERDTNSDPSLHNYYFLYRLLSLMGIMYDFGGYDNAMSQHKVFNSYINTLADRLSKYMANYVMANNNNPFYGNEDGTNPQWLVYGQPAGYTVVPPMAFPLCGTSMCSYTEDTLGNIIFEYKPLTWSFSPLKANFRLADCLPCSFGLSLPSISGEDLRNALMVIGITVTVVAISAAAISVAITKAQIGRQALKAERIKDARKAYLANPKNIEAKEAYVNLVWKYNFFGKVFGYGSYDGKNDWFDGSTSDSSVTFEKFDELTARFNSEQSSTETDHDLILEIRNHIY